MRYLVVGGHARGVGKTALVVDLIRAFPEAGWTAVKISPHGHGAWPEHAATGEKPSAATGFVLHEDMARGGQTGGSRYLVAGARRSFWLRAREGHLAQGMAMLGRALEGAETVILESNAVLEVLRPQLYLMVLDPSVSEFKASARRWLGSVDAFISRGPIGEAGWRGISGQVPGSKPVFEQRLGERLPEGLLLLIRKRLFAAVPPPTTGTHLPG